jgi:hypothetical protein
MIQRVQNRTIVLTWCLATAHRVSGLGCCCFRGDPDEDPEEGAAVQLVLLHHLDPSLMRAREVYHVLPNIQPEFIHVHRKANVLVCSSMIPITARPFPSTQANRISPVLHAD